VLAQSQAGYDHLCGGVLFLNAKEPRGEVLEGKDHTALHKQMCKDIIKLILSWPFSLNAVIYTVPNYFEIIYDGRLLLLVCGTKKNNKKNLATRHQQRPSYIQIGFFEREREE
jgi:hypothetical protein